MDEDIIPPPTYKSLPRVRRELTSYIAGLEDTMRGLVVHLENPNRPLSGAIAEALACAYLDRPYPPVVIDDELARHIESALQRRLTNVTRTAIMSVEDALAIAISAREGIRLMDALDERVPEAWSNLEPKQYVREVNRLAHGLCRGRVPGWSERQS